MYPARLLAPILAAAACLAAPACKESGSKAPAAEQLNIQKHRYTVRGVVEQLPSESGPTREFQVRHEAMPHFLGQDGALGMDTMTMPFPIADGLSLGSLKVKDKIELTFEVEYDTAKRTFVSYEAVAFAPLPPETELDFSHLAK